MSSDEVARRRGAMAGWTRDQLIERLQKRTEWSPEHIAAKQLLADMDAKERDLDRAESDRRHQEALREAFKANRLAVSAIALAALSAAIAIAAFWR